MPVPRITREDLKARIDAGSPPVIVDARLKYPYEHSSVQLPGAIRVGPDATNLEAIPRGRDIVVYDSDPDEIVSAPITAALVARGDNAMALKGGIAEWLGANFPSEPKGGAAAQTPAPASAAD